MTDRDLQKLNRKELLVLLVESEKENGELRALLEQKTKELENIELQTGEAGSLAEAALKLSGIFEAADRAVLQYRKNITRCNEGQLSEYDRAIAEAENKAAAIVSEAEQKAAALTEEAERFARETVENAEAESSEKMRAADEYWAKLSNKLESFYAEHAGLRDMMMAVKSSKIRGQDE